MNSTRGFDSDQSKMLTVSLRDERQLRYGFLYDIIWGSVKEKEKTILYT